MKVTQDDQQIKFEAIVTVLHLVIETTSATKPQSPLIHSFTHFFSKHLLSFYHVEAQSQVLRV